MPPRLLAGLMLSGLLLLTGCTGDSSATSAADQSGEGGSGSTSETAEKPKPPEVGACRVLTPEELTEASNDTDPVSCSEKHNAETFLISSFDKKLADASYDDSRLGAHAYQVCDKQYRKFTGADESLALRSILSWAWFRPTEEQWEAGARWFRCDVVGGDETSESLVTLPESAKGVLLGIPGDRWISCVNAAQVTGAPRVPCNKKHTWRAVTTIVVGKDKEKYPGDRLVQVISRDFCSDSVGAWMNYPLDYEYAYTWFHKFEWQAGNRRSICWAKTDQ